jgi:hypothetical protein
MSNILIDSGSSENVIPINDEAYAISMKKILSFMHVLVMETKFRYVSFLKGLAKFDAVLNKILVFDPDLTYIEKEILGQMTDFNYRVYSCKFKFSNFGLYYKLFSSLHSFVVDFDTRYELIKLYRSKHYVKLLLKLTRQRSISQNNEIISRRQVK